MTGSGEGTRNSGGPGAARQPAGVVSNLKRYMADKKYKIIGVGSPIVDSLARVSDAFLEQVEGAKGGMELVDAATMGQLIAKVEGDVVEAAGGSAGNTIFTLSRLGIPATFLGKIGNDAGAEFYKSRFTELGGDASRFKDGDVPNGRCLSLVTPDSERTMRTDLGAAMTLTPDEVTEADFQDCQHAHIEGYLLFNRDLMQKVLDSAKRAGCTISIDLASFEVVNATRDILPDILRNYVDIVFANEEEASAFSETKGNDYAGMAAELGKLCDLAVVKVGKEGSFISRGGEVIAVDPIRVSDVVDTTGAGDLWAAGFLYGWLTGRDLAVCGRFGSLLGAEVVQVMGASIPDERWKAIEKEFGA